MLLFFVPTYNSCLAFSVADPDPTKKCHKTRNKSNNLNSYRYLFVNFFFLNNGTGTGNQQKIVNKTKQPEFEENKL